MTGNYFQFLEVTAQRGRTLTPSDDTAIGAHPVVVIADTLWRRLFGADPRVVGTTVTVSSVPMTIVGVLPPSFHGTIVGLDIEMFLPFSMQPQLSGGFNVIDNPRARALFALTKLRPSSSFERGRAEVAVLSRRVAEQRPSDLPLVDLTLMRIADWPLGLQTYTRPLVRIMSATSLLLLLAVCANVAALVLARCLDRRRRGIAARLALGASRVGIVRIVLLETVILAVPGALLGFAVSRLAELSLVSAVQDGALGVRFLFNSGGTATIVATIVLAAVSAMLSGVVPALRAAKLDLVTEIKEGATVGAAGGSWPRGGLVTLQVAAAMVLLAGMAVSIAASPRRGRGSRVRSIRTWRAVTIDTQPAGYSLAGNVVFQDRLFHALTMAPEV